MSELTASQIQSHDFAMSSFNDVRAARGSQSSASSSTDTTPNQTPTQELSAPMIESSLSPKDQSRGRPRYKRRQPSQRYFTPPSRLPSPPRPDLMLEVESVPQDPDIFADAETDYFSSTEKTDGPRAFRRHFFDAMSSIDSHTTSDRRMDLSIDAQLAATRS